jgi:hypothetical protein
MKPLIFSHIPKTAGTSFRVALAKQLGKDKILNDYGKDEETSSELIKQAIYERDDVFGLMVNQPKAIIGHFPINKYLNLSCYENVICFVREPVERVISEFKHHQRHANYHGNLLEFAKLPQNKNKMHRYLRGLPWTAIGFIGIAERYTESLNLLNRKFNFSISKGELNQAPKDQKVDIYAQHRTTLKRLNHLDEAIYQIALDSFEWRIQLTATRYHFVHGAWSLNKKDGVLSGFAFYENSHEAVTIMVAVVNAEPITLVANKFHSEIHKHDGPRRGYVGFSLPCDVQDASDIKCFASLSLQPIPQL